MKCWKCGRDLAVGADKCLFCGVSMKRRLPATPAGKAMRMLYDRMGMQEVLNKKIYLTVALGDLMQDSQKLRNQLGMAMDSGMGSMYLTQIKTEGKPTPAFQAKVKRILTEDAGLSDKVALELMGYMDEMIGWQAGADAQKETYTSTGNKERPRPQPMGRSVDQRYTRADPQLQKLYNETYREFKRCEELKKLLPAGSFVTWPENVKQIYRQYIDLRIALGEQTSNISHNMYLPAPNPEVAAKAQIVLQTFRKEIDLLEKQIKNLT